MATYTTFVTLSFCQSRTLFDFFTLILPWATFLLHRFEIQRWVVFILSYWAFGCGIKLSSGIFKARRSPNQAPSSENPCFPPGNEGFSPWGGCDPSSYPAPSARSRW